MTRISIAFLLMASMTSVALAQDAPARAGALRLQTVVEKLQQVEDENGEVRSELVPVEVAVPGDEVVYTVHFTNVGDDAAENILITNPIPAEMQYQADSAFGPGTQIQYSADGGESYAQPSAILVPDDQGRERLASAADYTHIRWMLTSPLDPGAQGFARFRAVVR